MSNSTPEVDAPPKGVLQRGLLVLRTFVGAPGPLSLVDVATRTGLDKTTVFRLLRSLVDEGMVYQDPLSHQYQLHTGVLQLAGAVLSDRRVPPRSRAVLTALRDTTGESAGLHMQSGYHRTCTEEVESRSGLRMSSGVGSLYALCTGAAGKAIVAHLDEHEQDQILEHPDALGPWHDDVPALRTELDAIRARGWSVSHEETTKGARAVAAPVFDFRGRVVFAVNVSGPDRRFAATDLEQVAEQVRAAATELSHDLGFDVGA